MNWLTSQSALLSTQIEGCKLCIFDNLWLDKCPNLKCQSADTWIWVTELLMTYWEVLFCFIIQWEIREY